MAESRKRRPSLRRRAAARAAQAARALRMIRLYRTWVRAYSNRLARGPRPGTVVYELRSGVRLAVEGGETDIRVLNEIWLDRVYEPTPAFHIRDGWTVLDLGAHKGGFSVYAAMKAERTAVHAVEPSSVNLAALRVNLAQNAVKNVRVHECAVAERRGEAILQFDPAESHRGTTVLDRGYSGREHVRTATLDDLVTEAGGHVDLVKMDIEGAELSVLRSASPAALTAIERIVIEMHPVGELTADAVGQHLCELLAANHFRSIYRRERRLVYGTRGEEL